MNQVIKKILSILLTGALLAGSVPAVIASEGETATQISSLTLKQSKGFENGKASLDVKQLARYDSGMTNADGGVMEIIDYNAKTGWAYAVNGQAGVLSAIPLSNLTNTGKVKLLDGNDFEAKTAEYLPNYFNCSNDSIDVDDRSNKKGPEPESVTVGTVDGKTYAFVTLERIGGIMVYDITDPENVKYTNYINSRDFSTETGADDSPEGIKFVPAEKSPTQEALLLAACEVGGTVAAYELTKSLSADGKISIYFTNDVHCAYEKYDQVATAVKDKDILIDAGDNIQGDLIGTLSDGGYMVDILNYIGYDAAVPGNHEFDYGMDRFLEIAKGSEEKEKLADYDYISCNLREIATGTSLLDSYKIYEAEGKKVAVVGITTPETLVKSNPSCFKNENGDWIYDFSNDLTGEALYTAVQNSVNAAKAAGADYIIAVGHLGTNDASKPWTSTEVIA
ncbi:MAG: metallophosphoesterase, partial [Clostridia bacterium]|nr:metallophosphoesterase [Clostridia bacterium]